MSSPPFGFSPWRRRTQSADSLSSQEDGQRRGSSPSGLSQQQGGEPRQISSSFSTTAHREPIRSFIHGSFRDNLRSCPSLPGPAAAELC